MEAKRFDLKMTRFWFCDPKVTEVTRRSRWKML